ncbi:hypothetical protein B0H13DRAFT_2335987 [Mycena leptocephala]|nr:hypothetical protein B0H13DRAFT_2335987 [Mycena leptocephala]
MTLTRANARSSARRGKLAVDRATDPLFSTRGFRARRQLRDWDGAGGVVEMTQAREVAHTYARQLASRYSTCIFRARRHQLGTGVAPAMTMTRYHRPAGSTPFPTHASAFPPILHPSPSQASPTVSPRITATYITSAATRVHPLLTRLSRNAKKLSKSKVPLLWSIQIRTVPPWTLFHKIDIWWFCNMTGPRTDKVRAIAIWKPTRGEFTAEQVKENAPKVIEHVRAMPIMQQNITKYEVSFKAERLDKSLASDLGLKETDFSVMILVEGTSHQKIREALTSPEYKEVVKGALDHATTLDDFHFFSAEFVTVIDK